MDDNEKIVILQSGSGGFVETMPGRRDRKPDGRFVVGDLVMDRYKILAELGQGGMGVVYKCFDEIAGIEVALKALPPELSHNSIEMEDIKDNFQLVHNLHHPNIASLNTLEKNNSNGNYYLIMECCEGEDLQRWIKRKRRSGSLRFEEVVSIIRQVADALDYAHEQKIIHRDIKPGNIMINSTGRIKVLDFGLAAQIHTSISRISLAYHGTSGTGPYMAPEQWEGRSQNAAADQYALAVIAYEMLAGHLPFENSEAAVLREAVLKSDVVHLEHIPKYADNALQCAMSKVPGERFANCTDFALALSGKRIKTVKKNPDKQNPFKWVSLFLSVVIVCGLFFLLSDRQQDSEKKEVVVREEMPEINRAAEELSVKKTVEKIKIEAVEEKPQKTVHIRKSDEELDSENAALKVELRQKIKKIMGKNEDFRNFFEQKISEMNIAYSTAEEAKLLITANKKYRETKKIADFVLQHGSWREDAQKFKKRSDINRKDADRYEPLVYAKDVYTQAGQFYIAAGKAYKQNNFNEAQKNYKAAATYFEQAKNTAYDNKLQLLVAGAKETENGSKWNELKVFAKKIRPLNNALAAQFDHKADDELKKIAAEKILIFARQEKESKKWQAVHDYAVAALKVHNSSPEAKALKSEAEINLKPSLEIIALIDGKAIEENAKIDIYDNEVIINGEIVSSVRKKNVYVAKVIETYQNLQKNNNYKINIACQIGDSEYIGGIDFLCNWQGIRKMSVALKKQSFVGIVELPGGRKIEMVKVRSGSFLMGSPEKEKGRYSDEKQLQITLTKDFWIGKFEVTQAQWTAVMENNPAKYKGDSLPVESVSWHDAREFCNKLNILYAGRLPQGYRFDLPTEAQWEYACRAGSTSALNNNKDLTSEEEECKNLDDVAWYLHNSNDQTHPVGQKCPNAWGLFDMHGNVYEWCLTDDDKSSKGKLNEFLNLPFPALTGMIRVIRGGSSSSSAKDCRSGYCYYDNYISTRDYIGFRIALVPIK